MFRLARLRSISIDLACGVLPNLFSACRRFNAAQRITRPSRRFVRLEIEPLEERALLAASIFGNVFNDLVGDGLRHANDPGLSSLTVYLDQNGNHQLDTTVTTYAATSLAISAGAAGLFAGFGGFASTLDVANLPARIKNVAVNMDLTNTGTNAVTVGLVSPLGFTVPNNPNIFNILPGEHFQGTFDDNSPHSEAAAPKPLAPGTYRPQGYFSDPQAHILDGNPNGTWGLVFFGSAGDIAKLNLASWSLTFTAAEPSTQTDANGNYSFAGLQPGNYAVTLALSPGNIQTFPVGVNVPELVTVAADQSAIGIDFGVHPAPDLTGVTFNLVAPANSFGQPITVNYTLTNQGLGSAGPFDVDLVLSNTGVIGSTDPVLRTLHFSGLAAQGDSSGSVTVILPSTAPPGFANLSSDYVGFIIDPTHSLHESNTTNNSNQGTGIDMALLGAQTNTAVDAGAGVQNSPSIAVDPQNANYLVTAYMDYSRLTTGYAGIGVAYSITGGKTWADSSIPLPVGYAGGAADPKVNFDSQGHVYVSFMAATFLAALPNETDPSGSQRKRGFEANNGIFVARGDVQAGGSVNWNAPVAVTEHLYSGSDAPFDVMPVSAVDTAGTVYVAWARFYPNGQYPGPNPNINDSDIMIAASSNGGATWTTRLQTQGGLQVSAIRDPQFSNDNAGGAGRGFLAFPSITTGAAGDVYVATYSAGNFAVFHSTDGGITFTPPDYNINVGLPFFQQSATVQPYPSFVPDNFRTIPTRDIVTDPSHPGRIYAVAAMQITNPPVDSTGNVVDVGDVVFARSDDYGLTWQHLFTVGPNASYLNALQPGQRDNTLPVLNDDNAGQFIGFDQALQNDVVTGQAMPTMSVDAQGNLVVVWYDTRRNPASNINTEGNPAGLLDVFGTISTDGGLTFKPNFRITDTTFDPNAGAFTNARNVNDFFFGDAISVASANGSAYAVWTDTRNSNQDIYFQQFSTGTASPAPGADRFSPNNTLLTATPLGPIAAQHVFPKLAILPGTADEWFSLQSGATGELVVSATASDPNGTLGIVLTDASGNPLSGGIITNVLNSAGAVVGEQLAFPSISGQTYLVDVHGVSRSGISYALVAESLTADFGTQVEDTHADSVAQSAVNLYRLAAGVQGVMQVTFTAGSDVGGAVNLSILRADGQTVLMADPPAGIGPNGSEELDLPVTQGEVVFLQVSGANLSSGSGSFTLHFTNLDQFETPTPSTLFIPTNGTPTSLAVAALNGTGKPPSLLVSNTDASDTLGVLSGNGDGTFQAERRYDVGPGLSGSVSAGNRQLQVADLNNDGIPDAIVPNFNAGGISVLLGNGDGTFQPERPFDAVSSPVSLVTGVFTASGNTDAIALQGFAQGHGGASFSFLRGLGNGDFAPPVLYPTVFTLGTSAMVTGDFNRDGHLDLIVFSINASQGQLFLGNGDGTFNDAGLFTIPEAIYDAKVVDLNGDGKLDLVTTSTNSGNVYVMLGNGNGTFQAPQAYQAVAPQGGVNISIKSLAVVDFGTLPIAGSVSAGPADGHLDLVVTAAPHNGGTAQVIFLPGLVDSHGAFAGFGAAMVLATVAQPGPVVAGDFQGSGITDLAVADTGGVTVIFGAALTLTPITTPATARNLGDTAHVITQAQAIVSGHADAYFTYTVPSEAAANTGMEVVDISGLFQDTTGSGLTLGVTLADGSALPILQSFADPSVGARYRVLAPQGSKLLIHVSNGGAADSFGLYALDIDLLPQIVSAQAESALPGGVDTSIVLTLQGDRLDPASAENPANYNVFQLDAHGNPTGSPIPLSSAPNTPSVVYDASASLQVATGRYFPTAVRQTITLNFAQPLTADASYVVELSAAIGAATLNSNEDSLLVDPAVFSGHPVVGVLSGQLQVGAKFIVTATRHPGTNDQLNAGTPFLTQLHDDLGAQLNSYLAATGDNPLIPTAITNEILARFVPGWLASGGKTPYLIIWLDPVSIQLADPASNRTVFNLKDNSESNGIAQSFIEVGGSVEVMVVAAISGSYNLRVSDVQPGARGEAVVLDGGNVQTVAITGAMRAGEEQFQFTFPQSQTTSSASKELATNFTDFVVAASNLIAIELGNAVLSNPAVVEVLFTLTYQVQIDAAANGVLPVVTGFGAQVPGGAEALARFLSTLPPDEMLRWLGDRLLDFGPALPFYPTIRHMLSPRTPNNNAPPQEQAPPVEAPAGTMAGDPEDEFMQAVINQLEDVPPVFGDVFQPLTRERTANPLSGLVAASVLTAAVAYGYACEPEEERNSSRLRGAERRPIPLDS